MKILRLIGFTEILIGGSTLVGTFLALGLGINAKTPKVLFFVILTSITSTLLGLGILRCNRAAYLLLLYFSSVIFLSKVLIFLEIIHLNGALATAVPAPYRNTISLIYHALIIYYLARIDIQKVFKVA